MNRTAADPSLRLAECLADLRDGARQLQLSLTEKQLQQLLDYLLLLQKWNAAFNLSSVRNLGDMVSRHLLDSLSIAALIDGQRFIDVGTGPGLPGVPLAIAFPHKHFTLLDSNGKKTRFLFQVQCELKLDNIHVVKSRVEDYRTATAFDGVISRAFASLDAMLAGCRHLLSPVGRYYAMKGQWPRDEIAAMPGEFTLEHSHPLRVPGCEGQRHLLVITAAAHRSTPAL